jgi:putative peptidoglycan lipid II flippase
MAAQLWFGARHMGDASRFDDRFRNRAPRIVVASIVMGLALAAATVGLGGVLSSPGWRYGGLAVLISVGIVTYFATGAAIGAFRLSDFRKLRQR